MDKKQLLILGGTVLAGGAAFFYLSRNGGGVSNVGASPMPPAGVESMPIAGISPTPFNITDSPTYQTINFPNSRDVIPQNQMTSDSGDNCACKDDCQSSWGIGVQLSEAQVNNWAANVRSISTR